MNLRVPSCHDMIIKQGSGAASVDSILDPLKARNRGNGNGWRLNVKPKIKGEHFNLER